MTNSNNIEDKLRAIRQVVDTNTEGCAIDTIVELGKRLASIMGLSAEVMAAAQKTVQNSRLAAIQRLQVNDYPPSVLLKMADAEIGMELATYEYADRLNASITHQLDYFRTVISLHKSELENSLKA